ncbi:MFS transporter [bacterium]|nr:MFS transporter [bacterium]
MEKASLKEIIGWSMYDFANSAFATTILAVIFNKYFAAVVAGGEEGVNILGYQLHGAAFFTFTVSVAMAIVALSAPVLGAIADFSGAKKRFLAVFCYVAVIFTGLLYFIGEGDYWLGALFFIIANVSFASSNVFYNALLPEITTDENIGKVSGWGWGLGYIGGGLLLLLNFIMLEYPKLIGFSADTFTIGHCFLSVSIWWGIFAIPLFLWVRERAEKKRLAEGQTYIRIGFGRLKKTFLEIRHFKELTKFLISYLIYNDGIQTVIIMASIFGDEVLKMETGELITFFLMVQGTAFVGSLIFGYLADWLGNKKTVIISLFVWSFVVIWAFRLGIIWDAKTEYWILGVLAGMVLGGSQAASRALMVTFTPKANSAEFFGFFAVAGKFASIFGSLIYGVILALTGSLETGILSLIVFFVFGMFFLFLVNEKKGMEERHQVIG